VTAFSTPTWQVFTLAVLLLGLCVTPGLCDIPNQLAPTKKNCGDFYLGKAISEYRLEPSGLGSINPFPDPSDVTDFSIRRTAAYAMNAFCACLLTPDNAQANIVCARLQKEQQQLLDKGNTVWSTDVIYRAHRTAY
jgi:hypothetical protein